MMKQFVKKSKILNLIQKKRSNQDKMPEGEFRHKGLKSLDRNIVPVQVRSGTNLQLKQY